MFNLLGIEENSWQEEVLNRQLHLSLPHYKLCAVICPMAKLTLSLCEY